MFFFNKDIWVNLYKLHFLSSHFFLNQIKKFSILTFFHPLNQTQIRENKIFLSFYFFIYPHFLFSHFFISTKRILRWCDIFCNFRFTVILVKNKIKQKTLMSYYCNVHYINVFYSEPNASYCVICPLSLSLSLSTTCSFKLSLSTFNQRRQQWQSVALQLRFLFLVIISLLMIMA